MLQDTRIRRIAPFLQTVRCLGVHPNLLEGIKNQESKNLLSHSNNMRVRTPKLYDLHEQQTTAFARARAARTPNSCIHYCAVFEAFTDS